MKVYDGLFQDNGGNTGILFKFPVSYASLGCYCPEIGLGGYQLRDFNADNHYFMAGGGATCGSREETLVLHQAVRIPGRIRE